MKLEAYTPYRKIGILKELEEASIERRKEIMREHFLSYAELKEWCDLYQKHGIRGLQATAIVKGRRLNGIPAPAGLREKRLASD